MKFSVNALAVGALLATRAQGLAISSQWYSCVEDDSSCPDATPVAASNECGTQLGLRGGDDEGKWKVTTNDERDSFARCCLELGASYCPGSASQLSRRGGDYDTGFRRKYSKAVSGPLPKEGKKKKVAAFEKGEKKGNTKREAEPEPEPEPDRKTKLPKGRNPRISPASLTRKRTRTGGSAIPIKRDVGPESEPKSDRDIGSGILEALDKTKSSVAGGVGLFDKVQAPKPVSPPRGSDWVVKRDEEDQSDADDYAALAGLQDGTDLTPNDDNDDNEEGLEKRDTKTKQVGKQAGTMRQHPDFRKPRNKKVTSANTSGQRAELYKREASPEPEPEPSQSDEFDRRLRRLKPGAGAGKQIAKFRERGRGANRPSSSPSPNGPVKRDPLSGLGGWFQPSPGKRVHPADRASKKVSTPSSESKQPESTAPGGDPASIFKRTVVEEESLNGPVKRDGEGGTLTGLGKLLHKKPNPGKQTSNKKSKQKSKSTPAGGPAMVVKRDPEEESLNGPVKRDGNGVSRTATGRNLLYDPSKAVKKSAQASGRKPESAPKRKTPTGGSAMIIKRTAEPGFKDSYDGARDQIDKVVATAKRYAANGLRRVGVDIESNNNKRDVEAETEAETEVDESSEGLEKREASPEPEPQPAVRVTPPSYGHHTVKVDPPSEERWRRSPREGPWRRSAEEQDEDELEEHDLDEGDLADEEDTEEEEGEENGPVKRSEPTFGQRISNLWSSVKNTAKSASDTVKSKIPGVEKRSFLSNVITGPGSNLVLGTAAKVAQKARERAG